MKYLIYSNQSDARAKSADIATSLGCGRKPADVTRYWFGVIEHPETKEGAIEIPNIAEESKLAGAEKAKLKLKSTLEKDDWFAPKEKF